MWYLSYFCQLWLEICCWRNFPFFFILTLLAVDSALGSLLNSCMVCEGFNVFFHFSGEIEREATFCFFFRQSFHPRAHTYLSPYWHWAIKYLCCRFFLLFFRKKHRTHKKIRSSEQKKFRSFSLPLLFFSRVVLIEHVALPLSFFGIASSQLCGAIDFNIIDFLCHYQPLASLVFFFFFWFCAHKNVSVSEWQSESNSAKKHKIQKKALPLQAASFMLRHTSTPNDMARQI